MDDWIKYKNRIKTTKPELAKDLEEVEELSTIVGAMIKQRHEMGFSQRELAELCAIPQSSIARIEAGITSPNLSTLLKIFNKLGLKLSVTPMLNTARS
ncbi:helix-turn-helix domain-containing protein [Succinivibrio dextrinosolvens]|uniref:helix-turn-helix domain-containing protein n=1 Tax=Succinivibrio dextrinosolvens TaxID=83771 RepID=UPI00241BF396|nr:helix-turn-helix transcriptional regulator [Succinivibrio dextrinosolvens]MBE6424325.1 helix-turn-helix transcriptional regulator [Succinivibrio dextrinosolvens]